MIAQSLPLCLRNCRFSCRSRLGRRKQRMQIRLSAQKFADARKKFFQVCPP